MKRAAIYVRVSTLEQANEGYSVGEQKERLTAYCKAQDWVISGVYVDGGYSGSNLKRPGIQKLMSEIKNFDVVLVYKLDRLSRSQRDTLYLIEEVFLPNKVAFVSMSESFDTSSPLGKAMIGLLSVFAQLEREQIKERTRMGRLARTKAGLYSGAGKLPIGYNYEDGKLHINPYEAETVRKIYEWFIETGASFGAITKRLQVEGYTNRYTNYKHWETVRNILSNPLYTGRMQYGGVVVENAHEPIISKEQFRKVQMIMKQRREACRQYSRESKYLLTGLIFCGKCGSRYGYRAVYFLKKQKHRYYSCYSRSKISKRMIKDPNCKNKNWLATDLEARIEEIVKELLASPAAVKEISERNREKPAPVNNDNARIEKRIREIDKEINKFMELYKIDGIPPEVLGENINKLYNEKTALQSLLEPVKEESEPLSFDLVEELLKDAAQVWDFADTQQKRRILQGLIKRIVLTDDNIDIEWNF